VKTNGLMPMRSVFFSSCICVYLSVHHPCDAVLPLSFIPFHLTVIQLLNLSCHVRGQLPTLWEYNKMSLLNLAASLVKVGCSVAINFFSHILVFFLLFVTSIVGTLINDFHGKYTCCHANEDF
jgi:hypothetical protein